MPADPITPSLAGAWSNTPPEELSRNSRASVACRATANIADLSVCASSIDGVSLQGSLATVNNRRVLLTEQSDNTQNGIYVAYNANLTIESLGIYDGAGVYVKSGLVVGRLYYFNRASGHSVTNGTVTLNESGFIAPNGSGQLTFNGPISGNAGLNGLFEAGLTRATGFDTANELPTNLLVRVEGGTDTPPDWYVLTSTVATVGVSPVVFAKVTVGAATPNFATPFDNTGASPRSLS